MWKTQILKTSLFTAMVLFLLGIGTTAEAACASPVGNAGQLQWISPNVKYCNGTTWVTLNNTATATSCTVAGEIKYISGEIMYCNGSVWVKTAPATNHGACTTTTPGYFYYDTGGTYYWFCNGSNWRRMGP